MRTQRITTALAATLALSLGAGACGTKDATGPAISLTQEDVFRLADELGSVMSNYTVTASLRAAMRSLRAAAPMRAAAASVPVNASAACPGGGSTSLSGSYDETATTATATATFSYSGCKTAHFTTDGSFSGSGEATTTQTALTAHATLSGTLSIVTTDGRTGSCRVDVVADVTEAASGKTTYTLSGSACGVDVSQTYTPPLYKKPAGAIAVSIIVDDAATKVYSDAQLVWAGSMVYNGATNMITPDPSWAGPWPQLYDDGPMSAGGHEPEGAVAGDHKFGAVVFVMPPDSGATTYQYGMVDETYATTYGNGWIWQGPNGSFTVYAGATADQQVSGMTLKLGTTDVQLVLDSNYLDSSATWDLSTVVVISSAWGWSVVPLTNDGTGKYVLTLSSVVGPGKRYQHTSLASSGDSPQFVFVLGGKGYWNSGGASMYGVSAGTKAAGANAFTPATVHVDSSSHNTYIVVP